MILCATRGSTDLLLQGITFNTRGVDNFMESVIGISADDFVGKMEGFAVQGIQGKLSRCHYAEMLTIVLFRCSKKSPATSLIASQLNSQNHKSEVV